MNVEWMASAVCAGVDPDLWFPEGSGSQGQAAKKICTTCPVRVECTEYVAELEGSGSVSYRHGVWGGLSARQRDRPAPRTAVRDEKILRLVDRGMGPAEIAAQLDVSDRTVARVKAAQVPETTPERSAA